MRTTDGDRKVCPGCYGTGVQRSKVDGIVRLCPICGGCGWIYLNPFGTYITY